MNIYVFMTDQDFCCLKVGTNNSNNLIRKVSFSGLYYTFLKFLFLFGFLGRCVLQSIPAIISKYRNTGKCYGVCVHWLGHLLSPWTSQWGCGERSKGWKEVLPLVAAFVIHALTLCDTKEAMR